MLLGSLLIILGLALLLKNLGLIPGSTWDVFWPLVLILFGVSLLKRRRSGHLPWCRCPACQGEDTTS